MNLKLNNKVKIVKIYFLYFLNKKINYWLMIKKIIFLFYVLLIIKSYK